MMLADVRDYIEGLAIADNVYMGKMDAKKEKSIGVYHSKHSHAYKTAIGGPALESHGIKHVTILIHWNKSPRDTESVTKTLFEQLLNVREVIVNNKKIKFIQPLYKPQDVGTDDNGIYEMCIEAAVVYEKER